MNDLRFVPATPEHIPELLAIYNYYIEKSTATFHLDPVNSEEMAEILFYTNPRFQAFVISDSSAKICGYCILARFKKREAYDTTAEVTVYLAPEFTGKGIGSLAVKFIEEKARERNFHSLIAVICGENEASIRLFKGLGYVQCALYKEVGKKFGRFLDIVCYQKIIGNRE
ncbi:MAG TPA: GNAT family N-acetyltransferase [Bacillota bacterium]